MNDEEIADDEVEVVDATIPSTLSGVRLDRVVSMLTGISRSAAAELIANGGVVVDDVVSVVRSGGVKEGSFIEIALPAPIDENVVPDPTVAFDVVYEDSEMVVVNKPPGVVVHPGAGRESGTLVAGLLSRYPDIATLAIHGVCEVSRPGIVHRIDRGTSGLLLVARTPEAFYSFKEQLSAHSAGRRYLALVHGHLNDDAGVVDAPIGRSASMPTKMTIAAAGREARTHYVVLGRDEVGGRRVSLLSCTLETGRTHQIRVHLSAIGHPVVGDDRYGSGRTPSGLLAPGRLFLHAAHLSANHPKTNERCTFDAPLASDLLELLPDELVEALKGDLP
jgi:23S rRNA pseudouridine1911/1915/1917 synthase